MGLMFGVFGLLTASIFFIVGAYYATRITKARHVFVIGEVASRLVPPQHQHDFFVWASNRFHSLKLSEALTISNEGNTTEEERLQVLNLVEDGMSIDEAVQKVFHEKKKT